MKNLRLTLWDRNRMISIKLYCIPCDRYDSLEKENALIRSQGIFGVPWGTRNRSTRNTSILTLHVKARNTFMECYV